MSPNQRPTNQSKVTIHLASNNPAGGYKRQKRTKKPDARGPAVKAGTEEKRKKKKNEKEKKEKAETENKKGNQANDDGEENPAQFNSMVN